VFPNPLEGFPLSPAETQDSCKREIAVEIPAEAVARETEAVVQRLQKLARVPGFRRGKVPASVVRTRFAEDLKSEVVEALVPKFFRAAVEKQGLVPISQPRITDLEMTEGQPLRFKASFEVLPAIEVSSYKDLHVEKPEITVTDEEVEQALARLREQQATFTAIEGRAIQDGDYAQVSFRSAPKEGGGPGGNVDDVLVEVGGSNTVAEFSENLRGAKPSEERTFDVSYPKEFSDERLAGKTLTYTVTVKAIKQKNLPAADDAFAKEVGDFETLAALQQRIREGLDAEKRHTAEHEAKDKLVDELVQRHDFPVPEALVEHQIDVRLERGLRALASQGMRPEDMKKMDFPRLRAGQREAALKEVKASLLLDKIAGLEKIEVGEEEIAKEIEALAAQTKQAPEAIRARLTRDGALDRIRDRIRNEKTLDFLYRRPA
jgi:trigger factor